MQLMKALETLRLEFPLEKVTSDQYALALKRLEAFLGREATALDLTMETINAFLIDMPGKYEVGNTTVRNHRSAIIRLWRYCHDTLEVAPDCPTRRIRRPKVDKAVVRAWTLPELDQLLSSAEDLPGQLKCGVPARVFMTAWLWLGYETGLRPSDLRELTWRAVDFEQRTVAFVQHKTGGAHTAMFDQALPSLQELQLFGFDRVFPLCKWGVGRWESILYARAAKLFGFTRLKGMGIGTLRKTHATEIYRQHGIAASAESLGHRSGSRTAMDHYVDARAIRRPLPPSPRKRA